MSDTKTFLTPAERLRCAYAHYVLGIEQQHIAMLFAINSGRVNEACKAIYEAMLHPKEVRIPAQAAAGAAQAVAGAPTAPAQAELPLAAQHPLPLDQILATFVLKPNGIEQ